MGEKMKTVNRFDRYEVRVIDMRTMEYADERLDTHHCIEIDYVILDQWAKVNGYIKGQMKLETIEILFEVEDLIKTKILGINNMIDQFNKLVDRTDVIEGKLKKLKQCNLEVE